MQGGPLLSFRGISCLLTAFAPRPRMWCFLECGASSNTSHLLLPPPHTHKQQITELLKSKGRESQPEFFEPPSCPFYQVCVRMQRLVAGSVHVVPIDITQLHICNTAAAGTLHILIFITCTAACHGFGASTQCLGVQQQCRRYTVPSKACIHPAARSVQPAQAPSI